MTNREMSRGDAVDEVRALQAKIVQLDSLILEKEAEATRLEEDLFRARKLAETSHGTADQAATVQTAVDVQEDFSGVNKEKDQLREERWKKIERKRSLESSFRIHPDEVFGPKPQRENVVKNIMIAVAILLVAAFGIVWFAENRSIKNARLVEEKKIREKTITSEPKRSVQEPVVFLEDSVSRSSGVVVTTATERIFSQGVTPPAFVILPPVRDFEKEFSAPREESPILKSVRESVRSASNTKRAADTIVQNLAKLKKERDIATLFAENMLTNRDLSEREKSELLAKLTELLAENREVERILEEANAEFERDEEQYMKLCNRIGEYKLRNPDSNIPIPVSDR